MNISSVSGSLDQFSKEIQERFRTARSLQDVEDLVADYEVSQSDTVPHHPSLIKKTTEALPEMRK